MSYNLLIETLKNNFESIVDNSNRKMVNSIISGNETEVDNYKKNLFPLTHFDIINFQPVNINNTSMVNYEVVVTVVDIRDFNKEEDRDKIYSNDNRNDNWNTTAYILRTGEVKMIKAYNQQNISLVSTTTAEKLSFVRENTLDGWSQTWTVSVPDIYVKACDL